MEETTKSDELQREIHDLERKDFDLWSIWGVFSPTAYTAEHASLTVAPVDRLRLSATGEAYRYDPTGAETPLVDTTRSSISSVIGQSSIENLPLNGRDFTDFVLLTPGATTDGEFGMVSFNGIAGNFNNYTVDGGNNNNAFFSQQIGRGTIPFQFSEDIVQEFQVNTAGYEAEFGQSGGGLVNTVTKSGGNQFHGDGANGDVDVIDTTGCLRMNHSGVLAAAENEAAAASMPENKTSVFFIAPPYRYCCNAWVL